MAGTFRGHTFNALMQPNAVDDRPLAFRSTLAPFGTYANPDGSESFGFAWPAAVTEPINALQRRPAFITSNPLSTQEREKMDAQTLKRIATDPAFSGRIGAPSDHSRSGPRGSWESDYGPGRTPPDMEPKRLPAVDRGRRSDRSSSSRQGSMVYRALHDFRSQMMAFCPGTKVFVACVGVAVFIAAV